MAVKTKFTKQDFKKILANYNLGEFKKVQPFKLGAVQTNLLLTTSKGKYVFRYYENRPEKYALFETKLLQYLVKQSYPCSAPIKNIHGGFVGKFKNKPFAMFKFLEGEHSKDLSNYKQIVKAMGKLHQITIGYKPKFYQFRHGYNPEYSLQSAVVKARRIKPKFEAEKRLKWLKTELKKLQIPNNLPKGACHCDTHPSNFLYKGKKLVAVLDFDDASYIYLLYDIANTIYFWAWPHKKKIIFDKARKIVREYQKYRKLTELEKRHLYDMLKLVILISISWFLHDKKDNYYDKKKIEFLNSISRQEFYKKVFG
jgi:homoserine kinase type II